MKRREFVAILRWRNGRIATGRSSSAERTGAADRRGDRRSQYRRANRRGPGGIQDIGLKNLGWFDGRNIQIDYRFAAADTDRMSAIAKELVRATNPILIVGHTTPVVAALQRETKTIPIVFIVVSDPIGSGFVASLPHPGGNITGFINLEASLTGKWIEMLKEIVPRLTRVSLMFNPETAPAFAYYRQPFEAAARADGVEPIMAPVHDAADIERVFESFHDQPAAGLVVLPDIFVTAKEDPRSDQFARRA